MSLPLRQLGPEEAPSAQDWNRLVAHLQTLTGTVTGNTFGEVGMARYPGGGVGVFDQREKSHWAKISARGSGNKFAHNSVAPNDDGTFEDLPEDAENPYGSVTEVFAAEVNGRTGFDAELPIYVQMWPNPAFDNTTDPAWLFEYRGDGGTETVAGSCGGGCGTFVGVPDAAAFLLEVLCNEGEFDHADFAADFDSVPLSGAQLRSTGTKTWTLRYWDVDTLAWVDWTFDTSGAIVGDVVLTPFTTTGPSDGSPQLTIDTNTLLTRCVGGDYTFTGGRMNGFDGAGTAPSGANVCDPNDFTLRVSCTCPWPDGYYGAGFYGTADEDCDLECVAVELTNENICEFEGVICSERFDTLEEAEDWCEDEMTDTLSCDSGALTYTIPTRWLVTLTNPTGDITSLPAPFIVELVSNPPDGPALYSSAAPISIGHTACDNAPNETSSSGISDVYISCDSGGFSPAIHGELHTTNGPYGTDEYDEVTAEFNFTVSITGWQASCAGGGTIPEGGCDVKLTRVV